jgi:hypothetical protein
MSEVSLSIAIMHAAFDPKRADYLANLLRGLASSKQELDLQVPDFAVIRDTKGVGPWPVAKRAWEWHASTHATHHLTLQDDVEVCSDFIVGAKGALSSVSDQIVTFFLTRKKRPFAAFESGSSWIRTSADVYGQALCMPRPLLAEFLSWEQTRLKPGLFHDDTRVTLFAYDTGRQIWATVPSLVQHAGFHESTLGHGGRYKAYFYMGRASAAVADWSLGLPSPPSEPASNDVRRLSKEWLVPK